MARTPSTEDVYEGDGVTAVFQFHFPFLAATDVFVSVDNVDVSYTLLPGSIAQVQLLVPPPDGSIVKVYRNTLAIKPLHEFAAGVPFLPRYVDEDNRQLLYVSQEAINDTAVTAAEALVVAEEAKQIAQEAEDKIDGAIIDSAFQLRLDLANSAIGAAIVAEGARTVHANLTDAVNVLNVGPVDTPANTELTFATAFIMAQGTRNKPIRIPAGDYYFDVIPNLAANNIHLCCDGIVRLHCMGSAGTWAWDLTSGAFNRYNFHITGSLEIEGNATNTGGVHIQALHHSSMEIRALNVPGTAFQLHYGVLSAYKLTASINLGPSDLSEWTIIPSIGLSVDLRNTGEFVSACWFDLRMEGINGPGVVVNNAKQCHFVGTSEHNQTVGGSIGHGIVTGPGSELNIFEAIDLEQNQGNDIRAGGKGDRWFSMVCRSASNTNNIEVLATAENNVFSGGDLRSANMNSGSRNTHFESCRFSSNPALGMHGPGIYTHQNCMRYDVTGAYHSLYVTKLGQKGTFVPTLFGATTSGVHTYAIQTGNYEVICGRLFFDITIALSVKDAAMAGAVFIGGLPLASLATTNVISSGDVGRHLNVTRPTTGYENLIWRLLPGASNIGLLGTGFGLGEVSLQPSSINANTTISLSGSCPLPDFT